MPHDLAAHDDQATLRALAADWRAALEARDLDGLMASYADDVVLYDAKPPFRLRGAASYRAMWAECLPYFPPRFTVRHQDLEITVQGDLAFAHGLARIDAVDGALGGPATWFRATLCYRRIDGQWRVVHEHVSVPFNPMTGQAVFAEDPDAAPVAEGGAKGGGA